MDSLENIGFLGRGSIPIVLEIRVLEILLFTLSMEHFFRHISRWGMLAMKIGIEICHMQKARVRGRKFFHSRCLSWSYENHG